MAYGPYWYMGRQYSLPVNELQDVLKLTDWAAERLGVSFPAIDVAKTASGEWIIIEVNNAQESGFVGVNPLTLWNKTISAMQDRTWISVEDFFEEGTVIMGGDPLPDRSLEEMWVIAKNYSTTQELVDSYAGAHNKFWWVEDDEYDFEEGTEEHKKACAVTDAWGELMNFLEERVVACATEEGLLAERQPNSGLIKQLEAFMKKYGYRDGQGWWVRT